MSMKHLDLEEMNFLIQNKHGGNEVKLVYKDGVWVGEYNEEWDTPMSCAEFYHLKNKYDLYFKEEDVNEECRLYMEYERASEIFFLGDLKDYETVKRLEKLYSEFDV